MSETRERTKRELAAVIKEFGAIERDTRATEASEATARSWVERLLAVFGWNAGDPRQVQQEYTIRGQEVRRLRREGTRHLRPDYALKVGGERILYLDVKRFGVSIEDDENVSYQVRCYGWSAGFRVSYACDFQELAIWDCRVKPETADDARVARLHYFRYSDYLEHFDLLWDYLSREAIEGGSLQRRHPDGERPRGAEPLDVAFEAQLSEWRVELAKTIVRYGGTRDPEVISGAAQRILDRIVFLRLCEELGLEEYGALNAMVSHEDGFWPLFVEAHEKRYRRVYDGLLFPSTEDDDPTRVEHHLRQWWLKGRVFEHFVRGLYHPQPYCFDSVPLELLGGIYERFLGKRLRVVGSGIRDEFKPEYQRTKGAIYTPPWVVRRVVGRTLDPLARDAEPEALLALRILDPACGSGGFLLGAYDRLEEAILAWARAHPRHPRRAGLVVQDEGGERLSLETSRRIIEDCLYGVDIDPNAVEVARMSLALRHLERAVGDLPDEPSDILAGIGRNIRQGNSLVGPDIAELGLDPGRVGATMPFAWHDRRYGFGEVLAEGGFHAVVGNPPYIEVKRYREWMPEMYRYLKEPGRYVTADHGKTDIAMPFMEQSVRLLRPGGRMGFIIQNRFFKTEYGASTRGWLRKGRLLEFVEDFRDLQVFPGRTTYTTILVLQAGTSTFEYRTYDDLAAAQADVASLKVRTPTARLDDGPWSLDQPDLLEVHADLARRHGTIGQHRDLEISVGLQTLYGKLYQLQATAVTSRLVRGVNGLGTEVGLERKALRPLCRNRGFYPFRRDNADAWVIFPYDLDGDAAREIRWPEFQGRFPRAAAYLEHHRDVLKEAVEVPEGRDRWHLYTRPQNLVVQARPKVLFPSTIEDTVAAVDRQGEVYQDNVRINSIYARSAGLDLAVVAAVMNSTLFNALARAKAGLSDAGWRQFNRQFAELVPFPLAAIKTGPLAERLAQVGSRIERQQTQLAKAKGEGPRAAVRGVLAALWTELDELVERLYDLNPEQRQVIARYPRRLDRVELPLRAAAPALDEDQE
ncbi:MAG: N-6 DNA methylase [Planctomycetes bacterium]|nr:N-6 DNA methylase [Planctomycetota bacterium]